MLTRRFFTSCALCAVTGFIATEANAQAPAAGGPGIKRKILQQIDGPTEGYVTVIVEAEIPPGGFVAWHTHPGIESTYLTSGGFELMVKGQPNRTLAAGDGLQVPPVTPHAVQNGSAPSKIAATYIVKKGEPLATPVPAPV
jgi:quercetin dioxygenase-like cupin family protein